MDLRRLLESAGPTSSRSTNEGCAGRTSQGYQFLVICSRLLDAACIVMLCNAMYHNFMLPLYDFV
jgi:hypothetical protein